MRPLRVILAIVVYGYLSNAAPQILFPINSQVPPVARASIPFSFTFAPSTFSTELPNTYTLSNAPEWLSLDSETRTLSGTPTPEDANLNISITASDDTGSVTMNSELVVRTTRGPIVQIPLAAQPASFGAFSAPSTILYYPSSPFDIQFSPETFAESDSGLTLNYYAVSQNNTPLPSWVMFDAKSLSFSGQTPDYSSLKQPPEIFPILLIASDVEGFSGTSLPFNIAVGNHKLAFNNATIGIKAEAGTTFQFKGLSNNLELDGQVISASNLSSITAQMPSWLNFDNSTFILSGNAPTNAPSCNVTVVAFDVYGDIAVALINIDLSTSLFLQNITQLNATIGEPFSYNFTSSLVDPSNVEVTAQFEPGTSWLSFDPKTITLSGQVPNGIKPSTIRIALQASSKTLSDTQYMSIVLNVISKGTQSTYLLKTSSTQSTTSTSKYISASSTSSASLISSDESKGKKEHKRLTKGEIAAIVVPLVLLVLVGLSCIFWFCCYRQSRRRDGAKSPNKSDISGPVPIISQSIVPELGASHQALSQPRLHKNELSTSNHAIFNEMTKKNRNSSTLRKSQTMSNLSGTRSSYLAESSTSGNRGRSVSEHALSTDQSTNWSTTASSGQFSGGRRTQASAYPFIPSRSNSRATRNFSRKKDTVGHLQRDDSSNIFRGPSTTSRNSSIQQTPENNYDTSNYLPKKPARAHHPGTLVHDEDLDEFESDLPENQGRSALSRSTSSWFRDLNMRNRESVFSAQTQDTNVLFPSTRSSKAKNENRNSIRVVTPSPQAPPKAHLSTIEASPRTVYRPSRSNGGGGFFLGGSRSSSRTHRSPSLHSGYNGYSSNNSPALPPAITTNLNPPSLFSSNSKTTISQRQRNRLSPSKAQQSSLEKMVSAAGLRSSNDDEPIPDYPQNLVGLGIGHGKPLEGSNDGSLSHRLSFLSNVSNRFSETFRFGHSRQSFREGDTESQFQEAEDGDGTPGRYRRRDDEVRDEELGESDNESGDSGEEYGEDGGSAERSIVSEYARQEESQFRNDHIHEDIPEDNDENTRNSFKPRYSRGIPIEYHPDEESPTLGQGTLGEIQRVVVNGRRADGGMAEERGKYRGERVPNSPVVVALKSKVDKEREMIGGGRWDDRQQNGSNNRKSKEGLGLGLGLGLRLPMRNQDRGLEEQARIVGGRGRRPVSVNVGDGNVKGYEYKAGGVQRRGSTSAKCYGFGDDENIETFESGSAFL